MLKNYENYTEFDEILGKVIYHPKYVEKKNFKHHGCETLYDHCISVAKLTYSMCRFFNFSNKSTESATIAALLHDFYTTPRPQSNKLLEKHCFAHAKSALINSKKYFPELMTPQIENAIYCHMFPINIRPPRYLIGWIVDLSDDLVSFKIFKHISKLYSCIKNE